jgi:ubiquinol-cytochrome c reductase cytochrome c1 subunit
MLRKLTVLAAAVGLAFVATSALAASTREEPVAPAAAWSFDGPFGTYDQAQLQRGYKVYREVCSSCHSMNLLAFRNLGDKGGPFWDPKYKSSVDNGYVKAIAKDYQVADIDRDTGDAIKRPGTPADHFVAPFANEAAARASNGGALPPDMSLLARAREGGPDYIYSIVTGYRPAPAGLTVPAGKFYNPYMQGDLSSFWKGDPNKVPEGGFIAMPPPLADGKVSFDDKSPSDLKAEARDVSAFLMWAADPKMEERKQTGLAVMIFLLVFTGLLYASYRTLWRNIDHH